MICTIAVPPQLKSPVDIKEIHFISDEELESFLSRYSLDTSFRPISVIIEPTVDVASYHTRVLETALQHETNLAVLTSTGQIELYRVQEQKRAGREYPGVGVGIVIYNDLGQVLLTLRSGTTNNRSGVWDLPGGTVEVQDSLEETVRTEAEQETGLIVEPLGCIAVTEDLVEGQHWYSFAFVAKVVGGTLDPTKEKYKFDALKYFNLTELPANTAVLTRTVLTTYQQRGHNYLPLTKVEE